MIRIDPTNWTADFRIARALAEAYRASLADTIVFLCIGDPDDPVGQLGPLVGDEMLKYHNDVVGTTEQPVLSHTIDRQWQAILHRHAHSFVVGIEAGFGRAPFLGSVEMTDRGFSSLNGWDRHDMTINVVLRLDDESRSLSLSGSGSGEGANGRVRPMSEGMKEAMAEVGSDIPADLAGLTGEKADGVEVVDEQSQQTEEAPSRAYGGRSKFRPLSVDDVDERRVRQLSDVVIDGMLRLLSRIGKQNL